MYYILYVPHTIIIIISIIITRVIIIIYYYYNIVIFFSIITTIIINSILRLTSPIKCRVNFIQTGKSSEEIAKVINVRNDCRLD